MSYSRKDNIWYLCNNDGTKEEYFESIGKTLECIANEYLAYYNEPPQN